MNATDALTAMRRDGLYVRDQHGDVHHWESDNACVVTDHGMAQVRRTAESWVSQNLDGAFEEVRHER